MGNSKLPRVPSRTTPGFAFSMLDRALRECLGRRQFGQPDMAEVLDFFGKTECVYCGNKDVKRWDHLISIRSGGETVIGNIVPACSRCDDSKQHFPFEEWMFSDANYSPKTLGTSDLEERFKRIKDYVKYYDFSPRTLEDRLTNEELERLNVIKGSAARLREEVEELIEDYRERTSNS